VDGKHRLTPHARRMVVLAGSDGSFDRAADRLRELCRITVSDDVVRRVCDAEGERVRQWLRDLPDPAAPAAFAAAEGAAEFSTDGVKVNTVGGWREMRLSVLAKREPCRPARPDEWDERALNEPTARVAWCAIAGCGAVGSSWARMAERLGVAAGRQPLSVLADGARWIWEQAAKRFNGLGSAARGVEWVVDVYHLMLYLHAFASLSLGEAGAAAAWARARVVELIELGGPAFIERLEGEGPGPDPPAAAAEAWGKLLKYLTDNRDSLWYGERLKRGQPIGTGLIEGGCKNIIAARLKLNGARWRVRRAERMGAIRCLQYSNLWGVYWAPMTAAAAAAA
jgi:hypothetical protein